MRILASIIHNAFFFGLILEFTDLYAGQEATVRTGHGTTDWFQIGKRVMSRLNIVTLLI